MNEAKQAGLQKPQASDTTKATPFRKPIWSVAAWVVLGICLLVTAWGWHATSRQVTHTASLRFEDQVEPITRAIHERLLIYEDALHGGQAFFMARRGAVTREEWRRYVEGLQLDRRYPGIQGIGFSLRIPASEKATHLARIRAEGFPAYTIRPEEVRPEYHSIIYLEPFRDRNLRAFGYDMFSEPVRRAAMERARDSGLPTVSGKVTLVQETEKDVQAGFLMYLPVYRKGQVPETVPQRRDTLVGFVYSPFRMNDLMKGVLSEKVQTIDFEIFDGQAMTPKALLYDEHPAQLSTDSRDQTTFSHTATIEFGGRTWTLHFAALPAFDAATDRRQPILILAGGILVSLLLFGIAWSVVTTGAQAASLAHKMTEDLRESEQRFRTMADTAPVMIWMSGPDKLCTYFNRGWLEFTGRSPEQEMGNGWAEGVHPEDLERCLDTYITAFDARRDFKMEYRLRRHDGVYRWIVNDGVPRIGPDGGFAGYIGSCLDITERQQAEAALRVSEERYRDLVEHSDDLVCTHDLEGRILSANPAMARLFGYERPEELLGHKIGDYLAADVRHLFEPYLDTVAEAGYAQGVMKVVTATGEEKLLEYQNSLRTEGVDRPIVRGRSHDVTERVRARQAFAKRTAQVEALRAINVEMARELNIEALLELIVRHAAELLQVPSGAIFLWDETTETLSAAAWVGLGQWMEGLRLKAGEGVVGTVVERREGMIVNDYRTSRYAGPIFLERTRRTAVVAEPIMYHDRLIGVLAMNNEETDKRFTEQDREMLGFLAAQAAIAIENAQLYTTLGDSTRRLEELHTLGLAMQEPLGLQERLDLILIGAHTVVGFDRINILLPNPEGTMLRAVASVGAEEPLEDIRVPLGPEGGGIASTFLERRDIVWDGDGLVPEEWRLRPPYSEIKAFRSRAFVNVPLIVRGQAIGIVGADNKVSRSPITPEMIRLLKTFATQAALAIDNARLYEESAAHAKELERRVEERTKALKETQAKLIQSGKLAAVGTLAAGVAHELNQPLMVIRGYAQELISDERITDPELREDLRRIESQTSRMSAIITHLRDFSRQSKGMRQITDLNNVVTHAFTFLGQQLKARNIDVVQELDPALPTAWADALQIEQVLLNLVTNARDAMEAAGKGLIIIRTWPTADGRVALSVADTGPGIPPVIHSRIFEPFFTTKEVGKGTGLGLSICHGIMEEHGGELQVESPWADGRGARFSLVLPTSLRDPGKGDRV